MTISSHTGFAEYVDRVFDHFSDLSHESNLDRRVHDFVRALLIYIWDPTHRRNLAFCDPIAESDKFIFKLSDRQHRTVTLGTSIATFGLYFTIWVNGELVTELRQADGREPSALAGGIQAITYLGAT